MLGPGGTIENLTRLTGGANMESWSFDRSDCGYVLRRSPSGALMAGRGYGHDVEAALIRLARAHGVRAPEVVGELVAADRLGSGYLMRRVEGTADPRAIVADPPPVLLDDFAWELARIHAIPLAEVPKGVPASDAGAMVEALATRFESYGGDRPVMALALRWLRDHLPGPAGPVLLHGDFRVGNLLVDASGLAAVLDWELAHIGDRHQDLAFGCINSWRFGQIGRPAFGVGQLQDLFAAYQRESGVAVDPARFRFWLVYSTLWWGLCCLEMADIWRSGRDRSLERVVIGRRASETEIDLLMILEEDAPEAERRPIALPSSAPARRQGEPSRAQLLEALGAWIERDVKPRLSGRDRFQANVALNALGMLQREQGLAADRELSDDILTGRATLTTPGLLARLKRDTLTKLEADQPKYSALAKARQLWS
ncbi:phosphotransferase [Sphingomonas sp. MAH-20]|uniref:Phosphotransferase n=2 Tax=Sphingomonadaceae TaxID=41297 RepID=A0A6I4IYM9_9SPHN|nr:phosphotransferase family protein [Sphingomonas horti]MBA2918385.1 phosphotransferase family protein [Sphingomonas sp. CGMCC 1.13658]MVO77352.1 phosphotransferase [Sphingomonas horti]